MTSQHSSRVVVCVLVFVGVCASSAVVVTCPGARNCTTQHRIQTVNWFFDHITPKTDGPLLTLRNIGHLLSQYIGGLRKSVHETPREARQYYGAAGYANSYGATGYPGYGLYSAGSSSTSFNGLDAGLSAIAFLAFGVWLFNLVLPQLQGAGLGLPGLRRRDAPQVASGGVESHLTHSPGILSNILSSSQDFVDNIFNKDTSRQSKHLIAEFSGVETNQEGLILPSDNARESNMNTGDLMGIAENLSESQVASRLQQGDRLITDAAGKPSSVLHKSSSELPSQVHVPGDLWNSSRTWKHPEVNVRGRRRVEDVEDQGVLEHLLGQAWRPLAYLLRLLKELEGLHQFPKSRTQATGGSVNLKASTWQPADPQP